MGKDSSQESYWVKIISRLLSKFRAEVARNPSSSWYQWLLVKSIRAQAGPEKPPMRDGRRRISDW